MYDWNDLRYFLELGRRGTLSLAGQRLGVEHTTVSRRIQALETALGVTLFKRRNRQFQLTEAGRKLMRHAEQMEYTSDALLDGLSRTSSGPSGKVRLATPEAFGSQFLSPRLSGFYQRYPDIELELVAETRHLSLSKREADAAISIAKPHNDRLDFEQIGTYSLRLYAAPSYLKNHAPILNLAGLNGHDFIWYIEDLLPVTELRSVGRLIEGQKISFHSTNVLAQAHAAESGVGIALLPCFVAERMKALTPVLKDEINVSLPLWLAIHKDLVDIPRFEKAYAFLHELVKNNQNVLNSNQR
ncbi:LysR family transcriptional regulator [Kordiimonas sediminis]|uniref:LysR family transcriptional regulator n=1 Tax=Kordiimonas sediminis TaxID=1735581 RepID=A0A919E706_9PROT|nr:LysR family transcriptional regulator [Kordiimonas sediminis]GHF18622.1 LysR family transcriptional regulator [Kordiimonas sediminis]